MKSTTGGKRPTLGKGMGGKKNSMKGDLFSKGGKGSVGKPGGPGGK